MSGRVTMLGISRWAGKGGSYRTIQRFFVTPQKLADTDVAVMHAPIAFVPEKSTLLPEMKWSQPNQERRLMGWIGSFLV